jgi:plastocyanin
VTKTTRNTVRMILFTLLAALPSSAASAKGASSNEVEELRREVRQLRAQVQSLRSAIAESAELDKQRLAAWNRALKSLPSADAESAEAAEPARSPEPAPPQKPEPVAETSRAPSLRASAPRPTSGPPSLGPPARRRPVEEAAGTLRGRVDVPAGEPVAYVYVENVTEPAVRGRKVVIEQKGKSFVPTWAVVQRGTVIEFPNNDNIYHNVFSNSSGNSFDLGLYNSASEAKSHTFLEPGAVDIYCNIHPQMAASTLVYPNHFFAKVKPDGKFEIAGVPAGKRKVVAWAPGSRLTAQWVDLDAGVVADLNLKLESKSGGHKNKSGRAYGSYE